MDPDIKTTWPVSMGAIILLGLMMIFVGFGLGTGEPIPDKGLNGKVLVPLGTVITVVGVVLYFVLLLYQHKIEKAEQA